MADIGDPAVALMMDGGLIGATRLQVAGPDQLHVGGFRRSADHLLLRTGAERTHKKNRETGCEFDATAHAFHPTVQNQSALAGGHDSTAKRPAKTRS
jgi:hypothetical protein